MTERQAQLDAIALVARGLCELAHSVAFVGGATVALYVDDPAAEDVRATKDIDCVVEVSGLGGYAGLERQLRALGFVNATEEAAPICRWRFSGLVVDVMPTDEAILGFSNRWYPEAMRHLRRACVADDVDVFVFDLPYFVAAKLEAFNTRGRRDWLASHDLEDIIAVLDGATSAEAELSKTRGELSRYLRSQLGRLARHRDAGEIIMGHITLGPTASERAERIAAMLQRLSRRPQ